MTTDDAGYQRTTNEVLETLELAVIKESSLNSVTQTLYSTPGSPAGDSIKLLELDEHLLERVKEGDSLFFKGNKNESAVLCTVSQTYDIKEAETSNSCLLVTNLKFPSDNRNLEGDRIIERCNVKGIYHTYFEVKECKPKLERLLTVLDSSSFKGVEYESSIDPDSLYDWNRLASEIQASEEELTQALREYLIANINGHLRLVSFECEARTITYMLDIFDENSWEIDEVDKELTYESLRELVLEPVFESLFEKYTKSSDKKKEDGALLYRYDEERCCKILAKVLLAASPVTEYKQFMESWRIGTPEKMQPKEEYLGGIALITLNATTMRKEVVAFSEIDLPKGINERLNELFKAKDKWTISEITPYVLSLTTNKMNANALLTKYARCSIVNEIKYYSSKHGK